MSCSEAQVVPITVDGVEVFDEPATCDRPAALTGGCQPGNGIGPEDTFDGDYGRLLERAQNSGKGLASLSVPSWNQLQGWLKEIAGLRNCYEEECRTIASLIVSAVTRK